MLGESFSGGALNYDYETVILLYYYTASHQKYLVYLPVKNEALLDQT